ncbi:hypothetical protein [Paraburkholderia oxyphila]|uniref:hypothetical protein n=1 Tax=Paraburkholderia oxyphila TaxID=614212 RepID=UPI0012ED11C6|nr:hypothetical protein [Paraburkholderia oxyphila]
MPPAPALIGGGQLLSLAFFGSPEVCSLLVMYTFDKDVEVLKLEAVDYGFIANLFGAESVLPVAVD